MPNQMLRRDGRHEPAASSRPSKEATPKTCIFGACRSILDAAARYSVS
jgi:hypothetical protein